jgi:hypothetical protein
VSFVVKIGLRLPRCVFALKSYRAPTAQGELMR